MRAEPNPSRAGGTTRWAVSPALAGALAALAGAVALFGVSTLMRMLLRAPSLPEVVSEWATFYVPYPVFEYMINTFRGDAKVMLYWGIVAILALGLAGLGVLYSRRPSPRAAVAMVCALWLFTGLVLFPASEMGFFGAELRAGPLPVAAAYLASYAAFAAVLSLVYWLLVPAQRRKRGTAKLAEGKSA